MLRDRKLQALWIALAFGAGIVLIILLDRLHCPSPAGTRHRIETMGTIPKPGLRDLPASSRTQALRKKMSSYADML